MDQSEIQIMSPIRRLRRSARLQAALVASPLATPDRQRGCGRGKPGAPNSSDSRPVRRTVKSKGKGRAVPIQPTNNNVRTAQPSTAEVPPQETSSDDFIEWELQLPDHQATYEEEEELSGGEERGMDLYHDLDRDHATVDAALGTLEDEIIHQRPDAYSHQSAQQLLPRGIPTHTTPRRASSWDSRAAFSFSPISRLSPSAHSTSASSSSKLSNTWRHAHSVTSQTSVSKGKLQADHESSMDALNYTATERRTQIALLRNEHKAMKLQAHMRDKEIAHLEAENARDRVEAEKSHQRMMEIKRMDIELLQGDARVITLKIELAQLNATFEGLKNSSVCPGALGSHTTAVADASSPVTHLIAFVYIILKPFFSTNPFLSQFVPPPSPLPFM
ncbi:hypothetical protein JVT61DRAFT_1719 [Boletus reticuloceps]|uniref:Uncharacterized protein n=1 Tax=Boletus reticuloceps TaxID=495285 RepID=A0A8I2YTZ6_9AGAM|nr:hypothetical protein JVT61DRAFT_1719 [Boletus reticuloceps]